MALKKVKGTLERVLDKNLQDLVRGIRNHKENEAKYIAECIDEIKQELKQENLAIKANAVNKLAYLQMLGYDISWAAFNIIEVMSSTKFTFKRVGYLAASQCFHEGTDVLMLTTNMIRKDMSSVNMYDAGVSLSGLACFITTDLARDLANDIMTLMTSSKPYLRKKAVLILYKVFLQFPEALRPAFPRLKEKLEDPDPGVQSAAVNVICELARKNPKNYLSLAPLFFKLMTTSTNNWVLIKIIKLFGALTPLEPRLGKKLIEPLTNLIHSTSAMSLLYECINTVIAGIPNHSASIQLCVQKLRILIEDSDQNLKYLGLLAMSRILATHPKSVQAHKDLILQCLDDKDESIRLRALDLLYGMVTKKNLMEIVKKLMVHMDKAEGSHYRDELLSKIVQICSQSNYQFVTNFEWYVSILVELTRMEGTRHGALIAAQMLDVAIRVQAIRHFAVSQMAILLENSHLLANNSQRNGICEVLYAAAWICGEFSEHLKEPQQTLEAMLRPKLTTLPGHIQSIYVHNLLKLYCKVLRRLEDEDNNDAIAQVHTTLQEKLPVFVQSGDLEVQERACSMLALVKYVIKIREKGVSIGDELTALYAGELNPVAAKAQRKVPVPEGLDLDTWINEPESDSSDSETGQVGFFAATEEHRTGYQLENSKRMPEPTPEELEKQREARRYEVEHNPHYLKDESSSKKKKQLGPDINGIPVTAIDLSVPLHVPGLSSSDKYLKLERQKTEGKGRKDGKIHKKGKKKRRKGKEAESEEEEIEPAHAVSTVLDAPEGVEISSDKEEEADGDPYKMLDVNLDAPLRDDEILPVRTHRIVVETANASNEQDSRKGTETEKPKKKHKKEKEREKKDKKEKKGKKKTRSKSEPHQVPSLLLANGGGGTEVDEPLTSSEPQAEPDTKPIEDGQEEKQDLDFWLSATDGAPSSSLMSKPSPSEAGRQAEPDGSTKTSKTLVTVKPSDVILTSEEEDAAIRDMDEKPKKKKKGKKEKKEKKEKKKLKEKRSEYIEAEGITTPSKENLPPSQQPTPMEAQLPPMSSYKLLAENTSVKMTYEVRINHQRSNQVVVSIVFVNLTSHTVKDIEFNILDSLNTRLIRGLGQSHHDAVKVPFTLPPATQNEGQFAFTVDSIVVPQKMRGTLTYIVKTSDSSTQEKVDFRINLPCSAYLLNSPCKSDDFAALLGSGELSAKSSIKVPLEGLAFSLVLAHLTFFLHFRVVEQIADSASLFSRSIQGHPVCLLVKLVGGDLAVDGKSSDDGLLSHILDDVKVVISEASASRS